VRIATWNVRAGGKPVENINVLSRLHVDVALLQEANGAAAWSQSQVFHRAAISSTRRWASGVVALNGRVRPLGVVSVDGATWELHRTIPGALAVGEYDTGVGDPITVVCLYGLMENRWVYPTLLRLLADLSPLLYGRRRRPLILGGDFNAGATKKAVWGRIYQPVWDTLAALGLVDLTRHTAHTRLNRPGEVGGLTS